MRDFREKLAFRLDYGEILLVFRCHHALEHDPAIRDIVVNRQINPAETAVGNRAHNFVLIRHDIAGFQARRRLIRRANLLITHYCIARILRCDVRQVHHAVGDGASTVRSRSLPAKVLQRFPVRGHRRIWCLGAGLGRHA